MDYVLALDQGTTSSRAMLFDAHARVCATAQQEFAQSFPKPGWVEHDPGEIWRTQIACARQVLNEAGVPVARVRALGITNQRETTVIWDRRTGEALAPAIVWQDRRTAARCDALRAEGHAARIREVTGLELDAYFSATKLAWLLDHIPDARARAARGELAFGTIDSWLIWHLTGGARHVTDISNAARTMLFDIHRACWDETLLGLFDIPAAMLPEVVDSSGVVGHCDAALFGEPIPIAGIAGDQQAATFGQACLSPGMAKNTYGTGCFLTVNTGAQPVPSQHRLLTTVAWRRDGQTRYLLEGSVFMAGAVVQWLRDGLGIIRASDEIESLAAQVTDSGEVVMVPAFAGLGAPHWDAYARGTLMGMTRGTTAAHIARAALEAVALQNLDLLTAMAADGAEVKELRVDGGMTRNALLMQLQADLLGVPVVRPEMTETTVLGAAFLAGRAVGVWPDDASLSAHWRAEQVFEPAASNDWREAMQARWQRAVERARGWADGA
ncbi:glycerol kinase GlpK [Nitrogeniibacter mangrovi]|uniref:Glycerol kinase n=1 Tax=Nitrogeniibacter mangrovi TaxID=2016596 RepID=A0A6C1B7E4_9RHOO|nr:glycerol kinase GlpK [Nitrogeniibacter mangrovi]QID18648.1 glycerol kinase GlpK [Nitrogeniibacter mangrovi]